MITSKVSYDQMYTEVNPATKNAATVSPKAPKNRNDAKTDAPVSVNINNSLFEFTIPQSAHSAVNKIAEIVRGADRAMLEIENQIDQMKDQLANHVKNFPPFLPGSEERMQMMKRFSTFRKQIDQLTFPPDNYGVMKILADPSRNSDAGDWEIELDDNAGKLTTIHSQQVHSGPEGLNIQELPDESTDDEIYGAIENLEAAKEILGQRRNALSSDFRHIVDQTQLRE
jgi:hypothetical protein